MNINWERWTVKCVVVGKLCPPVRRFLEQPCSVHHVCFSFLIYTWQLKLQVLITPIFNLCSAIFRHCLEHLHYLINQYLYGNLFFNNKTSHLQSYGILWGWKPQIYTVSQFSPKIDQTSLKHGCWGYHHVRGILLFLSLTMSHCS